MIMVALAMAVALAAPGTFSTEDCGAGSEMQLKECLASRLSVADAQRETYLAAARARPQGQGARYRLELLGCPQA